jgi:hypothetical protein
MPVTAVTTTSVPASPPSPSTAAPTSHSPDLVAVAEAMEKAWQARRRPQNAGPLHRV